MGLIELENEEELALRFDGGVDRPGMETLSNRQITGPKEGLASCLGAVGADEEDGCSDGLGNGVGGLEEVLSDDKFVCFFSTGVGALGDGVVGISAVVLDSSVGNEVWSIWKRAILKRRSSVGSNSGDSS
jgi:hypothetical protein